MQGMLWPIIPAAKSLLRLLHARQRACLAASFLSITETGDGTLPCCDAREGVTLNPKSRTGVDPKSIVTVVGNLPHAVKGQQLRFVGDWMQHLKHGWQLKATAFEEVVPRSPQAVAAYLASTIDGVLRGSDIRG